MTSTSFRNRLALQLLTKQGQLNTAATKGFTLIELLVVIVILGVLGAVGYQAYLNQIARANANTAANTATALAKNCAALRVTGDQANFAAAVTNFVDPNQVALGGTAGCAGTAEATFTVTVGSGGGFARSAEAIVRTDGQVTPATPSAT